MINLAGERPDITDYCIGFELEKAGIEIVDSEDTGVEVPYSIKGKLGTWTFRRAWTYWVTSTPERIQGLILKDANRLHFKKYPIEGERTTYSGGDVDIYGKVVRVAGHCGCPEPKEWAFPTKEQTEKELKRLDIGQDISDAMKELGVTYHITSGELAKLCNEGQIEGPRFVDSYHIDTQEGLNEFARLVKFLNRRDLSLQI